MLLMVLTLFVIAANIDSSRFYPSKIGRTKQEAMLRYKGIVSSLDL
jgi:hypothetical protein